MDHKAKTPRHVQSFYALCSLRISLSETAMGNASCAPDVELGDSSFKVKYVGHAFVNDCCEYDFFVQPPAGKVVTCLNLDSQS